MGVGGTNNNLQVLSTIWHYRTLFARFRERVQTILITMISCPYLFLITKARAKFVNIKNKSAIIICGYKSNVEIFASISKKNRNTSQRA